MAGFIVHLPGYEGKRSARALEPFGLDLLCDESIELTWWEGVGPNGGGVFVQFGDGLAEYDPTSQKWQPTPQLHPDLRGYRYWIGCGGKSAPQDLARENMFKGPAVKLLDGNMWQIPIAEFMPRIPSRKQRPFPEGEHEEFIRLSNIHFRYLTSEKFAEDVRLNGFKVPRGLQFVSMALSKNYRINLDAVQLLGLVGDLEAYRVVMAAAGGLIDQSEQMIKLVPSTRIDRS